MRGGVRILPPDSIADAHGRLLRDLAALPAGARAIRAPVAPRVRHSDALRSLAGALSGEVRPGVP
jgi:nicotinate phosphoribosyltransferase